MIKYSELKSWQKSVGMITIGAFIISLIVIMTTGLAGLKVLSIASLSVFGLILIMSGISRAVSDAEDYDEVE